MIVSEECEKVKQHVLDFFYLNRVKKNKIILFLF